MEVNVAASCLNCFTSERTHSTHCVGGWASRAGLDTTSVSQTRILEQLTCDLDIMLKYAVVM